VFGCSVFGSADKAMYLVWMQGPNGPQPQKWSDDCFDVRPEKLTRIIYKQSISDSDALLSLRDLTEKFPPSARDNQ
jgi:hypothetical protein